MPKSLIFIFIVFMTAKFYAEVIIFFYNFIKIWLKSLFLCNLLSTEVN